MRLTDSFMYKQFETRYSRQPHRHPSFLAHSRRSSSTAEKNRLRHRRFSEAMRKSAAMTPALAAAGRNTRNAMEREEARLTKGMELRHRHDAMGFRGY